jgi:hypothetical protein
MTQHVSHRRGDEVHELRAEIERLQAALAVARQDILGHYLDSCGDHCENAVAKIDAALSHLYYITTGQLFNLLLSRINWDGMDPRSFSLAELKDAIDGAEWPKSDK